MALTKYDEVKISGVLLKGHVTCYDDLYFDTSSKYGISDLLEAIINILYKNFEKQTTEKFITNSLMGIYVIICRYNDYQKDLKNETIEKIRELENNYNRYLKNNANDEKIIDNELLRNLIEKIRIELVNNQMNCDGNKLEVEEKTEEDSIDKEEVTEEESTEKLRSALLSMNAEIEEYKKQIKELEKKNTSFDKKITKKEKMLSEKIAELESIKSQLSDYKSKAEKLEKSLIKLENKTQDQESTIKQLTDSQEKNNTSISQKEEKIAALTASLEIYEKEEKKREKIKLVEESIFNHLCISKATIEELMSMLKQNGLETSYSVVLECLKNLKKRVNITTKGARGFEPSYGIDSKWVEVNKTFNLTAKSKKIDILAISDCHSGKFRSFDIRTFHEMYEYCSKNHIHFIIDLGDFYSFDYQAGSDKANRIEYTETILNETISKMPYDKNIHHAILGGNHDRNILEYGIDPLEVLASSRRDIINLGYDHAALTIGSEKIMLHHPNRRFPDLINNTTEFVEYINEYYKNSPFKRDYTLIDLFGHFHRSVLNEENGYLLMPSLTNDTYQNGAWHIRLFFDELGTLTNVVLIPIVYENKFIPVNEIVYKKNK